MAEWENIRIDDNHRDDFVNSSKDIQANFDMSNLLISKTPLVSK